MAEEKQILLSTSTSTMKTFAENAQHHALLLALKVDELTVANDDLKRKLDLANIELSELKVKK